MKLAFSLALLLLLGACDQNSNEDKAATAGQTSDTDTAVSDKSQSTQRYTKAEFENLVSEKTKAQIRSMLGSPNSVDDTEDSWCYFDLPVYDADAGTQAHLTYVRFAGMEGHDDFVVSVRYD